jgi:Na+-transporting methylmalonyl-CoA/oxaloacetate decarboxylase gamma subunit
MIELGIIVVAFVFIWLYAGKGASETTSQPEESAVEHKEVATETTEVTPEVESVEPVTEAVVTNETEENCVAVSVVPQDSTLRRHYMQNLMANKEDASKKINLRLNNTYLGIVSVWPLTLIKVKLNTNLYFNASKRSATALDN